MKHTMQSLAFCTAAFCFLSSAAPAVRPEKQVQIVASGETHAMLQACDCEDKPGGGFAKRASLIALLRDTSDLLLVDAGGFAGGGMYDSYTEGRQKDSLRTMAALRAMGYMKYDAVCIGDDDLQYGGLWLARQAYYAKVPLVSANCFFRGGTLLGKPYVIVKKGNSSFGITAVTTEERMLMADDSIVIKPPVEMLRKIWKEMNQKSDFQIILAHVGESASRGLLDSFPDCGLVVNGHRKNTTDEFITPHGQVMLQFGYQGKSLSFAGVVRDSRGIALGRTGWIDIGKDVPDEQVVAKIVTFPGADSFPATAPVLDLYIMGQCQYGIAALKQFVEAVKVFPSVQWQVWFIGTTYIDGALSSLHGSQEIDDELVWLSVQANYPQKWIDFLEKRSLSDGTTEAVVRGMGLNLSQIKEWARSKGRVELRKHYLRSMHMAVNASPTLLVNNAAFPYEITKPRLAKAFCGQVKNAPAYCDSLPGCFGDNDCRRTGKTGTCVTRKDGGRECEYKDALVFTCTVIIPDSSLTHPQDKVIAGVADAFPGVKIDTVRIGSARGKALAAAFSPGFLPYFLFDKTMAGAPNFSTFESGLILVRDSYVFKPGMIKPAYLLNRKFLPGSRTVFLDPAFSGSRDAVRNILKSEAAGLKPKIMPLIFAKPDSADLTVEEKMRQEEAMRWLVLSSQYPAKYEAYLDLFVSRNDVSYWFVDCKRIGIDVDTLVIQINARKRLLSDLFRDISELGMTGPVELMIDNREVVQVKNQKELMDIMTKTTRGGAR
jgi:hypothetical protein